MTNYKLIAIQIGEKLKYGSSINEINRIAGAIFSFKATSHPNDSITSRRAQLVYDWIMTLSDQPISEQEKENLLSKFLKELAPEFLLSKLSEGLDIVKKSDKEEKPLVNSNSVFVLMPFQEPFQTLYYNVIEPVVKSLNFSCSKADDNLKVGTVIDQILDSIKNSLLIIADATGKHPNVFYELGLAHCLNKEVLIIAQNEDDIPFDIAHIRHFKYKYEPNFDPLKSQFYEILKKNLEVNTNGKRSEL